MLLLLACAAGIRKGAVGMVHLYSPEVQSRCVELGLTTHEIIRRNKLTFKILSPAIWPMCWRLPMPSTARGAF